MAYAHSQIVDHSYDSLTEKLTVYFLGGGKYIYDSVPYHIYEKLLHAKHKSKIFQEEIKDKFKYEKIY